MSAASSIRKVGVVAKMGSREAVKVACELAEWLRRRGVEVDLDEAVLRAKGLDGHEPFREGGAYDLVVVLGGDGTLLGVARNLADGAPLLGVNLGTLGFLTEIGRGELYPSLVRVLEGQFSIEERALLDVELARSSGGSFSYRAFNDAVISKGARSRIIEMTLRVDGHVVAHFRSDGLIISTPTGSTAYNLSAAGPILFPLLPATVLTPICPHTLSLRPVVVPDGCRVEITLETQREEVHLTLDGQEGTTLAYRDTVRVTRCPERVRLIKISGRSFYDSLRDKLRWGGLSSSETGRP